MKKRTAIFLATALLVTMAAGIWFFSRNVSNVATPQKPDFTSAGNIAVTQSAGKAESANPLAKDESVPTASEKVKTAKAEEEMSVLPLKYKMAIIIDDIGQNYQVAQKVLSIDENITLSILPFLPASQRIAQEVSSSGGRFLLHIPLEPQNYPKEDPGQGKLLLSMTDDEIRKQAIKDIEAVPSSIGVNNHMGSRFSENEQKMDIIASVLKEKNLFFVDSRTSSNSKGESSARKTGIQTISRDVFLDNDLREEELSKEFKKAISIAKSRGYAVIIGHPHMETIDFLQKNIELLARNRIEIVNISELVK